jgi:hypothetical protein
MTPADAAIARRLRVQCERFGWMTGMRTLEAPPRAPCITIPEWDEAIVVVADDGDEPRVLPLVTRRERPIHDGALPDPHDPATVGCFAAMARKARNAPGLHVAASQWDGGVVMFRAADVFGAPVPGYDMHLWRPTEIEAWLAVLETTP